MSARLLHRSTCSFKNDSSIMQLLQNQASSASPLAPVLQVGGWFAASSVALAARRIEQAWQRRHLGGGLVGSDSGLVAACLFRVNTSPRKPIDTKIAPAIISQCGNSIDQSRSIYLPFAFGRSTRASRNSVGPLVRRRLRSARSSGGAAGSIIFSIAFVASSWARNFRPDLATGRAGALTVVLARPAGGWLRKALVGPVGSQPTLLSTHV